MGIEGYERTDEPNRYIQQHNNLHNEQQHYLSTPTDTNKRRVDIEEGLWVVGTWPYDDPLCALI
jgi:hypothetical protein